MIDFKKNSEEAIVTLIKLKMLGVDISKGLRGAAVTLFMLSGKGNTLDYTVRFSSDLNDMYNHVKDNANSGILDITRSAIDEGIDKLKDKEEVKRGLQMFNSFSPAAIPPQYKDALVGSLIITEVLNYYSPQDAGRMLLLASAINSLVIEEVDELNVEEFADELMKLFTDDEFQTRSKTLTTLLLSALPHEG